jgi:hypothetical protein
LGLFLGLLAPSHGSWLLTNIRFLLCCSIENVSGPGGAESITAAHFVIHVAQLAAGQLELGLAVVLLRNPLPGIARPRGRFGFAALRRPDAAFCRQGRGLRFARPLGLFTPCLGFGRISRAASEVAGCPVIVYCSAGRGGFGPASAA